MEVLNNNRQIETYEKVNVKETEAKTFRGYLNGCIIKSKGNLEMEILFRELLSKFNKFYPQKIVKNEIKIIGWKGKGSQEIYKGFDNDFRIIEYIKDKFNGEVKEHKVEVKKEDLNKMLFIIKNLNINQSVKCYYISKKLGYESWKELWKERKQYFKYYYYPIKCIEAMGLIKYSGRGDITRIL